MPKVIKSGASLRPNRSFYDECYFFLEKAPFSYFSLDDQFELKLKTEPSPMTKRVRISYGFSGSFDFSLDPLDFEPHFKRP